MSELNDASLSELCGTCVDIARDVGDAILRIAREPVEVRQKSDGTPLTRADVASHRAIVARLSTLGPRLQILSEEGEVPLEAFRDAPAFWLVDPLDGTKEFVKGLGEYTVNIALVERARPILGVVHAPASGTTWFAARGAGAMKQIGGGDACRLTPSRRAKPTSAVVSRSHLSEATVQFLERNGIGESVSHGSSIKICAVAEGAADVYPRYGPTNIWDTGAGAAVALEAGCRVVDLGGRGLSYDPAGGTLREGFVVFPEGMSVVL